MKTRCSSAPRMQTVLTPRVKDGRISNDSPQNHYYGKTAPRFGHSNHNYHYKYHHQHLVQKIAQKNPNIQNQSQSTFNR